MFKPNSENIVNKIIIEFGKTIELFDLTPAESRLFAYLYLVEEPLTLDDMGDALGKSKTSMSTSVRTLLDLNLVTRVWKKGVRKSLYQANPHLFKSFIINYVNKWVEATNHQKEELNDIKAQFGSAGHLNDGEKEMKMQLENIIEFHQQVAAFFLKMK